MYCYLEMCILFHAFCAVNTQISICASALRFDLGNGIPARLKPCEAIDCEAIDCMFQRGRQGDEGTRTKKKIPEIREVSTGIASMIQLNQGKCGGYGDAGTHNGSTSLNPAIALDTP